MVLNTIAYWVGVVILIMLVSYMMIGGWFDFTAGDRRKAIWKAGVVALGVAILAMMLLNPPD